MPNRTVRASATALPKSRRAALSLFAAAPAVAILGGAAIASSAGPDPVFSAIERHKEAHRAFEEAIRRTDEVAAEQQGREITQAERDADAAASAAESEALDALLELPPVTAAGMRAVLEHVSSLDDGYYLDALAPTLLRSPLLNG